MAATTSLGRLAVHLKMHVFQIVKKMTLSSAITSQLVPGQVNHSCFVKGALQVSENHRLRQAKIEKFGKRAPRRCTHENI